MDFLKTLFDNIRNNWCFASNATENQWQQTVTMLFFYSFGTSSRGETDSMVTEWFLSRKRISRQKWIYIFVARISSDDVESQLVLEVAAMLCEVLGHEVKILLDCDVFPGITITGDSCFLSTDFFFILLLLVLIRSAGMNNRICLVLGIKELLFFPWFFEME